MKEENKIICILKREKFSVEESEEYEEKVESDMEMYELLEDLGKVIAATHRLNNRRA